MKDVLAEIVKLREARGWSEYQLAEKSGLPQSTISSWYRKKALPSVTSLERICDTFGITMSSLFADDADAVVLSESQKELLKAWSHLDNEQQDALLSFLRKM
ncbi:MAG: helix-turn-helix transcriptional regulator [Clostridia bacterium]|nr:helix-turn-helix transcriptional regulator [Clostridia bacterium]